MSSHEKNAPKVSIIMGIYNCADTLDEAIESIINQTFTDWELIMCDDGSTDDTYKVAQNYQIKDPSKFILLKNEKNQGLNYTLNYCLQHVRGDYVARMDGDDISLPNRLEQEVDFLDNHNDFAIVSTPMIFFDESGDWGKCNSITKPERKDLVFRSPVHCHAPCMIRREAYLDVEGYTVDPKMLRFEDVNLWFKLYSKGYRGYNLPDPLYKMRDDRNATQRRSLKSRMNGVYVLYDGFKRFKMPWYMYTLIYIDFCKHVIKGLIPTKLYEHIHRLKLGAYN